MNQETGFTLIELLVVIAIMVIIVSSSLINYNKMGRHIELENAAYNIALTIREAQIFGINKQSRTAGTANFGESYRYGVYFNRSTDVPKVSSTKFIIYLDSHLDLDTKFTNAGGLNCTGDGSDECYSQIILTKGNHVSGIYFYDGGGWNNTNESSVDISFVRPNPDAIIIDSADHHKSRVRIVVKDYSNTIVKCVDIGTAGDIDVKANENCDV